MRKINFLFVIVLLFSLLGCNASSETATDFPSSTQTNTPIPTVTPKPATPTVTPFPPLQTDGPFFSYFRRINEEYQLVMLDADGKGRKEISFPQEIKDAIAKQEFYPSMQFVSPTGEWMAYFIGSAGKNWFDPQTDVGPFELRLKLFNLVNFETITIASLLSEDYPNNFVEAEKQIGQERITANLLRGSFIVGITKAFAWSPDGKYLAFAGQMNGLSSDLYVYEIETKKIQRLSNGSQELQGVSWSPDGKKILFASTYVVGMGTIFDVSVMNVDGTSPTHLSSSFDGYIDWLNEKMYFEFNSANGLGKYKLRLVNTTNGNVSSIWKGSYQKYVVDIEGGYIALASYLPDIDPDDLATGIIPDTTSGLYIINLSNLRKTEIKLDRDGDHLSYNIYPFGLDGQKFILLGQDLQSYFISENLELIPTDLKDVSISVAPDNSFWAGINDKSLNIYSTNNTLIKSISLFVKEPIESELVWNLDSSGLFIVDDINIYFVDIIDGMSYLIESSTAQMYFDNNFLWLNNK